MRSRGKSFALYGAALALSGALLGVQFGRAAIGEIDPGFYRMWDDYHSFAQYSAAHDGTYPGEAEGLGVQIAGCTDCALGTGQHPWMKHAVFSDEELGFTQAVPDAPAYDDGQVEEELLFASSEAEPEPRGSTIERYAYYPIDANDRPVEADVPPAADGTPAVTVARASTAGAPSPDSVPIGM